MSWARAQSGRAVASARFPRGGEPHRLDARVGVRGALYPRVPLQQREAPRHGRLLDGERVGELAHARLAQARDGGQDAELGDPEPARAEDVVVELRHRSRGHAEGVADTGALRHAAMLSTAILPGK
jgi:hypothetical protein